MDFWTAVITCLKKYITFSGRASRSEYWYFKLFCTASAFALAIMEIMLNNFQGYEQPEFPYLVIILSYAVGLPLLAVETRRFHDIGRSGWWVFAMNLACIFLPSLWEYTGNSLFLMMILIILLTNLFWTCQKGNTKKNDYGLPPSKIKKGQL